jgi:hypothetical protein
MNHPLTLKSIIKWHLKNRLTGEQLHAQKAKSDYLKKEGLYRSFPYERIRPVVMEYPFYSKSDKCFFDFYYSVSYVADSNYIPPTVYTLYVEPVLNDFLFAKSIDNKGLYENIYSGIKTPPTILRKIDGFFYDRNYIPIEISDEYIKTLTDSYDKLILKASIDSGGGKNIRLFLKNDNVLISGNEQLNSRLLHNYPDFVMQEVIVQHEYFRRFNDSSNNTIRILTYKSVKDNRIHVLHILLRIGQPGAPTDHDNMGGIVVGINFRGKLNDFGCNYYGIKYKTFNGINFQKTDEVPYIDEIKSIALQIAKRVYYGRLLAMDFTVDTNGNPLLLEINCHGNGICQYQMNNSSLLKEFTSEVLEYCINRQRKYYLKL